ncbi:MAG: molybdate ABC transporter substrate-binding protein [Steroidobacteraceae bacterium]
MRRRQLLLALPLVLALASQAAAPSRPGVGPLLVFAAASLTNALQAVGTLYTRRSGQAVTFSFAASSTLARQIAAGAQADVFFSADTDWMNFLESRRLIDPATRRDIVGNRLALIAPSGSSVKLVIRKGFDLASALGRSGRLALAEPESVPAGRYARDALRSLGVWQSLAGHLIPSENVRAALEYVARGDAPLGIVYATDALIEPRVRIVGFFPPSSHPRIDYPAAAVPTQRARPPSARAAAADRFVRFLVSPEAQRIFHKYGFQPP